jgi:deoxyribose-phosphate aldolase
MSQPQPTTSGWPSAAEVAATIDHTLLTPEATEELVVAVCEEGRQLKVRTVCLSPSMIRVAAAELSGSGIGLTAVVGFPSGAHTSAVKVAEAMRAVEDGATELDMVIDLGAAAGGRWHEVEEDVAAVRGAAPEGVLLKVIIESAALDEESIVAACRAAVGAGAGFVKTSTGFHPAGGATVRAVALMAETVGPGIGVKASGGIRTAADAVAMLSAGATRLGMSRTASVLAELDGDAAGQAPPPAGY